MLIAKSLTRRYGSVLALEDAGFEAAAGQVLALLGPNGAGKSTAMKLVTGMLAPDSGETTVGGFDVHAQPIEARKLIGWLPEEAPLYPDMEVREYLRFCGQARGIKGDALDARITDSVAKCGLASMLHRPINTLSRGYRQRTGFAQALLHEPRLLVLDEPTAGLDPAQIAAMHTLLKQLASEGRAVIFSTHILSEAQAIASRVAVINRGRVLYEGSIDGVARAAGRPRSLRLRLAGTPSREFLEKLSKLPGAVGHAQEQGNEVLVALKPDATADETGALAFDALKAAGLRASSIAEDAITLEQAYLALIEKHEHERNRQSAPPVAAAAGGVA